MHFNFFEFITKEKAQYAKILFALSIFVCSTGVYWQRTSSFPPIDFCTLWSVPQALSGGPIDIYSYSGKKQLGHFLWALAQRSDAPKSLQQTAPVILNLYNGTIDAISTPFMYALLGWLCSSDFDRAIASFRWLNFICLIVSLFILGVLLKIRALETILLSMYCIGFFMPCTMDLRAANFNQLQLLNLSLFAWCFAKSEKPRFGIFSGLIIGIGIMAKPTIALVLVITIIILVIDKKFKKLLIVFGGGICGLAIGYLSGALFFRDFAIWTQFLNSLHRTLGNTYPLEQSNIGLANLMNSLFSFDFSILILGILLSAICVLSWFSRSKTSISATQSAIQDKERNSITAITVVGLGSACMVLSAGLVWTHYYLLVTPLFFLLLALGLRNGTNLLTLAGLYCSLFLLSDLCEIIAFTPLLHSIAVNCSVLTLVYFALSQFYSMRKYSTK